MRMADPAARARRADGHVGRFNSSRNISRGYEQHRARTEGNGEGRGGEGGAGRRRDCGP